NTQIPDRTKCILEGGESPVSELVNSAKKLEEMGADFIVIPCNTAHHFYDEVDKSVDIEVVNMIEETAKYIKEKNVKTVGLLSTTGTIKAKVYDKIFDKYNIQVIKPSQDEQRIIMDLIYGIKEGENNFDIDKIKEIIYNLEQQGCLGVILGCTELPIAIELLGIEGEFIDPTSILASVAVKKATLKIEA
ncbi:MAG: aspartate/glutamate racemase family protein, partial [Paraclostridium sp.]